MAEARLMTVPEYIRSRDSIAKDKKLDADRRSDLLKALDARAPELAYFWAYEYRIPMRDLPYAMRRKIYFAFKKAGLAPDGESAQHQQIIDRFANSKEGKRILERKYGKRPDPAPAKPHKGSGVLLDLAGNKLSGSVQLTIRGDDGERYELHGDRRQTMEAIERIFPADQGHVITFGKSRVKFTHEGGLLTSLAPDGESA